MNEYSIFIKSAIRLNCWFTKFDNICVELLGVKSTTAKSEHSPGICTPNEFSAMIDGKII